MIMMMTDYVREWYDTYGHGDDGDGGGCGGNGRGHVTLAINVTNYISLRWQWHHLCFSLWSLFEKMF